MKALEKIITDISIVSSNGTSKACIKGRVFQKVIELYFEHSHNMIYIEQFFDHCIGENEDKFKLLYVVRYITGKAYKNGKFIKSKLHDETYFSASDIKRHYYSKKTLKAKINERKRMFANKLVSTPKSSFNQLIDDAFSEIISNLPHSCKNCSEHFSTEDAMRKHDCCVEVTYTCEDCGKTLPSKKEFNIHHCWRGNTSVYAFSGGLPSLGKRR